MFVGNAETDLVMPEYLEISFGIQDFEGVRPHSDDPVVISITTSGYKVARVLIDCGNSTNVIY